MLNLIPTLTLIFPLTLMNFEIKTPHVLESRATLYTLQNSAINLNKAINRKCNKQFLTFSKFHLNTLIYYFNVRQFTILFMRFNYELALYNFNINRYITRRNSHFVFVMKYIKFIIYICSRFKCTI